MWLKYGKILSGGKDFETLTDLYLLIFIVNLNNFAINS